MPNEQELRARVKEGLRQQMRALRVDLPDSAAQIRSARVRDCVYSLRAFSDASIVAGFFPIHGEVDLRPLLLACVSAGKRVALPRVDPSDDTLVLHEWRGQSLNAGAYGIAEPDVDDPLVKPEEVDFALIPALAADEHGLRIGYGKGYYDRLIPTMSNATNCIVTYDFQLVAEVPALPHDVAADWIVTDARTIEVEHADRLPVL